METLLDLDRFVKQIDLVETLVETLGWKRWKPK